MLKKINNDKGVALITALLVLAVLTMLGLAATLVSSTDMQIAGNEKVALQGQYAAEAGIEKAMVMLNTSTTAGAIHEPSGIVWGSASTWSHPVAGTVADENGAVFYSFTTTVSYKQVVGGGYNGKVAFFNRSSNFPTAPQASGGWPVFQIRSVARKGNFQTQASILEVTKNSYTFQIGGGFTAGGSVQLNGNPTVSGVHHDVNGNAVATGAGCKSGNLSQAMPAVFLNGTTTYNGNPNMLGSPGVTDPTQRGATVPSTPWGALGMAYNTGNPKFTDIFPIGTWPKEFAAGASLTGNQYYKDDDNPKFSNENITGNGLMIIHNPNFVPGACADGIFDDDPAACAAANAPAVLDANTGTYKGVIVADRVSLRGNVTIIGAVISLSTLTTEATGAGNPVINYSCQAIEKFAAGQINKKLSWRKE